MVCRNRQMECVRCAQTEHVVFGKARGRSEMHTEHREYLETARRQASKGGKGIGPALRIDLALAHLYRKRCGKLRNDPLRNGKIVYRLLAKPALNVGRPCFARQRGDNDRGIEIE